MLTRKKLGYGLLAVLTLFLSLMPNQIYASEEIPNFYGPQHCDPQYLYWGDNLTHKFHTNNGMTLSIDHTSISYQNLIATVYIDPGILAARNIMGFYVLKQNAKKVDEYVPLYYNTIDDTMQNYYVLNIDAGDSVIGSKMQFQVVAVTYDSSGFHYAGCPTDQPNQYVVAWTALSEEIQFKPLPVIDRDAISVLQRIENLLQAILAKLQELLNSLADKLDKLTKAVEDAYKFSPEAMESLEQAMQELQDKMPMEQLQEQIDELSQELERTRNQLKAPNSELKLGGEFEMIPGVAESKITFLDLTHWKDQVRIFREIMQAAVWVWFVYMVIHMLTPKPRLG